MRIHYVDCCDNCFWAMKMVGKSYCGHEDAEGNFDLFSGIIPRDCPLPRATQPSVEADAEKGCDRCDILRWHGNFCSNCGKDFRTA